MTRRSERDWLSDIVSWGERLQGHLAGIDRETFFADKLIQDAVSKCVEAMGEAAGKLDDLNPELDSVVPDLNLNWLARRETAFRTDTIVSIWSCCGRRWWPTSRKH